MSEATALPPGLSMRRTIALTCSGGGGQGVAGVPGVCGEVGQGTLHCKRVCVCALGAVFSRRVDASPPNLPVGSP
jgi:hypothetical protein